MLKENLQTEKLSEEKSLKDQEEQRTKEREQI